MQIVGFDNLLSLYFTLQFTTICYNYVLCQEILKRNYSIVKSDIRTRLKNFALIKTFVFLVFPLNVTNKRFP